MKLRLFIPGVDRMKLVMAEYVMGRILLHVACAVRGGKVRFHLAGIHREIGKLDSAFGTSKREKGLG